MRNGVTRPNLAVHLCGSHGGTHTGTDGSSTDNRGFGDIPNSLRVVVMHPCDDVSTKALTMQLPGLGSPSYIRTARNKTPVLYDGKEDEIQIGKGVKLTEGNDVAIIACGVLVHEALIQQRNSGVRNQSTVVDMHTIKPLDTELIDKLSRQCGAIVTAEDHSVIGGLGGAVAEHVVSSNPVPIEKIGVNDRFGESAQADEMLEMMGLKSHHICDSVRKVMRGRLEALSRTAVVSWSSFWTPLMLTKFEK